MKVKVGDQVFDDADQPVMVILTKADKVNIAKMLPSATRYCSAPDSVDRRLLLRWMKEEKMAWSEGQEAVRKAEVAVVREAARYVAWCRKQIARGLFIGDLQPEEQRLYDAVDALAKTKSAKVRPSKKQAIEAAQQRLLRAEMRLSAVNATELNRALGGKPARAVPPGLRVAQDAVKRALLALKKARRG